MWLIFWSCATVEPDRPRAVVVPLPYVEVDVSPADVEVGVAVALSLAAAQGSTQITVDRAGLETGDELLIVQSVGTAAGTWARARVSDVTGPVLTLASPLTLGFVAPGAQVVEVFTAPWAVVGSDVTRSPPDWDGKVGGVLAIDAEKLTVQGALRADGAGLRSGRRPGARHAQSCTAPDDARSAERGEGLDGVVGLTGFGAPSTGGGGGNCHNAGGGGGGNGGVGGQGGYSWVNEANGRGDVGGRGGQTGSGQLRFGGGGGAGQSDKPEAPGGAGGGVVWIRASVLDGGGVLSANGAQGVGPPREGAGGGGAGGTLWLEVGTVQARLEAFGGRGADAGEAQLGPGGGGAGGVIVGAAGAVDGGAGGVDPTGDSWGARAGSVGVVVAVPQ